MAMPNKLLNSLLLIFFFFSLFIATNAASQKTLEVNREEDLLPKYVGSVPPGNGSLEFKGTCFYNNKAWLEFHNMTGSRFGGATLHLQVSQAHNWTCMDVFLFATPYRVDWDFYFLRGRHIKGFKQWAGQGEFEHVKTKGISLFVMPAGRKATLQAYHEVKSLFENSESGEKSNLEFLRKRMGTSFVERPQPWVSKINADEIRSGTFIAVSKIRGPSGAFETLEKWVTGAYAGHAAVCLRDSSGKLWVAESGHENEQKQSVVDLIPWENWWEFERTKDDASPHLALLYLHPDMQAKFNQTAAMEYAQKMKGRPYGYHNVVFSWIDTVDKNYPPQLDGHLVASAMTVFNQVKPEFAGKLWKEALNKRLGTKDLDIPEIIVEAARRGSSIDQLLTVPEHDEWIYKDGPSVSCIAHVLRIYKEAGLFGPIASSIQATEFTVRDGYMLKIFEDNPSRLPSWCNNGGSVKLPFCQIIGKYRMELPGYNTIVPYPNMNEKCPSLPPTYDRPGNC